MTQEEINKKCMEIIDKICDDRRATYFYRFVGDISFEDWDKGVRDYPVKYIEDPSIDLEDDTPTINKLLLENRDLLKTYDSAARVDLFEISETEAEILRKYKGEGGAQGYSVSVIEINGKNYTSFGGYDCDSNYFNDYYTFKRYNINGRDVIILTSHTCMYNSYREYEHDVDYVDETHDETIYLD